MADVRCIIRVDDPLGSAARHPVWINGQMVAIDYNRPISIPEPAFEVLAHSSLAVERLPDSEETLSPGPTAGAGAVAAGGPGGTAGGGDVFDPEAVIQGTVAAVEKRLAGLTDAQLLAVEDAEQDREIARKGVLELITKARVRLIAPKE